LNLMMSGLEGFLRDGLVISTLGGDGGKQGDRARATGNKQADHDVGSKRSDASLRCDMVLHKPSEAKYSHCSSLPLHH
jgi:hypothetical protein